MKENEVFVIEFKRRDIDWKVFTSFTKLESAEYIIKGLRDKAPESYKYKLMRYTQGDKLIDTEQKIHIITNNITKLNQKSRKLNLKQNLIKNDRNKEIAKLLDILRTIIMKEKLWQKVIWECGPFKYYWAPCDSLSKRMKLIVSYMPPYSSIIIKDFTLYKKYDVITLHFNDRIENFYKLTKGYGLKIRRECHGRA